MYGVAYAAGNVNRCGARDAMKHSAPRVPQPALRDGDAYELRFGLFKVSTFGNGTQVRSL